MLNKIDLSRVDLNLLVLFEAVMQEQHVGRAAHRLHLTASAVSHGIGRLRVAFHDPLFLKHPKGVVPTARATTLAGPITEALEKIRSIVGGAERFDPAKSQRRFTIGAPDAIAAVVLPSLLNQISRTAPGIDIGWRDTQPSDAVPSLDAREIDIALYPLAELPARFTACALFEEEFVVAARSDHPIFKRLSIETYCAARHLLVSRTADPHGFVDLALEQLGYSRRIVLTVPSFLWALAAISEGDLVGTLPRTLVQLHASRFGLKAVAPPFTLSRFEIRAVTPVVAMRDAGVEWLMSMLERSAPSNSALRKNSTRHRRTR